MPTPNSTQFVSIQDSYFSILKTFSDLEKCFVLVCDRLSIAKILYVIRSIQLWHGKGAIALTVLTESSFPSHGTVAFVCRLILTQVTLAIGVAWVVVMTTVLSSG